MADPTSGVPLPIGYTPDTLANYYKSLTNPIDMDTAAAEGSARTNAAARGLEGTPTETGGVAAADYYGGLRKDSMLSGLAFNMAGLSNQDALIKQQQDWQGGQAAAQRDWQSGENRLNRAYGLDTLGTENRYGYQSSLGNLGARMGGMFLQPALGAAGKDFSGMMGL